MSLQTRVLGGTAVRHRRARPAYDITLWDIASRQGRTVLQGHTDVIEALAFSPDRHVPAGAGVQFQEPVPIFQCLRVVGLLVESLGAAPVGPEQIALGISGWFL